MSHSLSRRTFIGSSLAVAAGGIARNATFAAEGAQPHTIGDRTCLFLDDHWIASQQGLNRSWHQGKPETQVILAATEAWEAWPHLFGSVLFDAQEQRYKMWYQVINPRASLEDKEGSGRYFVCYAESADGKTWVKPNLGLVSFLGSANNNIFRPEEAELPNVFLDPQAKNPTQRFKMLIWLRPGGHTLFGSGDGRRWTKLGPGVPPYGLTPLDERPVRADTNLVIWDALGQRYLSAYRTYPRHEFGFFKDGNRRGVGFSMSRELLDGWSTIKTSIRAEDADDNRVLRMSSLREERRNWSEPYIMTPFVYGNHYLGLVSMLDYIDGNDFATGGGALELAFSNDGDHWQRPSPGTPAIERRASDELFPCYAAVQPPLVIDSRHWHFYSEANGAHPAKPVAKSRIRAASWRLDGFASLATSGTQPGNLTTARVTCPAGTLRLNASIDSGGTILIEVLDKNGQPIPGYAEHQARPVVGDGTSLVVQWQDRIDFDRIKDQPIQLRMKLHHARLYSFRFAKN